MGKGTWRYYYLEYHVHLVAGRTAEKQLAGLCKQFTVWIFTITTARRKEIHF